MEHTKDYDVAILGAGFAGVYAAKSLASHLGSKLRRSVRVALIADENYMVFQPMLPEVAGAALSPRHVVNPVRNLCRDATVYKAKVNKIDLEEKVLRAEAGSFVGEVSIRFDHLAICLGAVVDSSKIPGMQEHAFFMRNVGDAMRLRATVISRFEEANLAKDEALRRRLLSFVVVGGGYSGVETAGQLLDLGRAIHRYYRNIDLEDCSFAVVHSRDHLLPTAHRSLGDYTAEQLRKRGLKVILNSRIKAITANRTYLDNGDHIDSNTIISTVGNAPHPLVRTLPGPITKGLIETNADCSVDGMPWLWAAGDCAANPHPDGGTCPPTAQFAMRQGELIGRNIARRLKDKPTKAFEFRGLGELASIGHHTAVAEIKNLRFSGFIAWWMWRSIYLIKLPGLDRKLRVMFEWTMELFFPRDINLLNPRYTSEISETYLQEGDALFHSGDPAFSFYIVKKGAIELREDGNAVRTIGSGQHFGERALLNDGIFKFDAFATEPTTLVAVSKQTFRKIVESDVGFSHNLQRSASSYLSAEELERICGRLPEEVLSAQVSELMTKDVVKFNEQATVDDALKAITQRSRSHLPICGADGKARGAVLKETLYHYLQTSEQGRDALLNELPTISLPNIAPEKEVRDALAQMAHANASKALVVDNEGKLIGIFSLLDVLREGSRLVAADRVTKEEPSVS